MEKRYGQHILPLVPSDVLVERIHEEVPIASADGAVAVRNFLLIAEV